MGAEMCPMPCHLWEVRCSRHCDVLASVSDGISDGDTSSDPQCLLLHLSETDSSCTHVGRSLRAACVGSGLAWLHERHSCAAALTDVTVDTAGIPERETS